MPQIQTLERAFELARSGEVTDVNQIRLKLKEEGLELSQLQGPSLLKQLRALIAQAHGIVNPKAASARKENSSPLVEDGGA